MLKHYLQRFHLALLTLRVRAAEEDVIETFQRSQEANVKLDRLEERLRDLRAAVMAGVR